MKPRRGKLLLSLVAGAAFLFGCQSASNFPSVQILKGAVFVDGQPAEAARVFFVPVSEIDNPRVVRPFAVTAADGSFQLTSYNRNDGAASGDYLVTVVWPKKTTPGSDDDGPVNDRLQGAYADPRKPKLRATVKSGQNTLEPFQLKSKG